MRDDDQYRARQLDIARGEIEGAVRHLVAAMRREMGRPSDSITSVANLALLGCEEALQAWDRPKAEVPRG